jgi:hypothetical protein
MAEVVPLQTLAEMKEKARGTARMAIEKMVTAQPLLQEWRAKLPIGKQEVVECPVCHGRLSLDQSPYNGHIFAKCETKGCLHFQE